MIINYIMHILITIYTLNHSKILLHTIRVTKIKTILVLTPKIIIYVEKFDCLYISHGNVKW